jgi:hemolysin activation/secretion protein
MSVRSKARTLAIVLATLATPLLARANFDPDAPPAGAFTQTEGPRYWVGEVDIRYAEDHPLQPPVDLIRSGQYALGQATDGYVGARRGGENYWFALSELGLDGAAPVYATGVRDLCEQVVSELGNRGLIGVYVAPDPTQIDPDTGADLRGDDTRLTLVIHTGRVRAVRTFTAATAPAPGAPPVASESPDYEQIAERSPLQPVGAGDPLAKKELDSYVATLNRLPGRVVDVVITPTLTPGIVNLDYLVSEDKPWSISSSISDTGTEQTGDWRQRFSYANYQLTGHDDVLLLDYLTGSFDKVNAVSGSYETNLPFAYGLRARANSSWSQYAADQFGFNDVFKGEQYEIGGSLIQSLVRRPGLFVDGTLGARWMHIDVTNFSTDASMPFFVPELAFSLERVHSTSRMFARLGFEQSMPWVAGTNSSDIDQFSAAGRSDVDDSWRVLSADARGSFFLVPLLRGIPVRAGRQLRPYELAHEIAWRVGGQYSLGTRLIPQAEGVLGGPGTVRGYPQSIVAGDSLLDGSVEYRFHVPLSLVALEPWHVPLVGEFRPGPDSYHRLPDWDFVLATFFDYGQTWNQNAVPGEENATLASLGIGLEMTVRQNFSVRFDYGFALSDVDSADVKAGDTEANFSATVRY